MTVKTDHVNPFVESAAEVLRETTQMNVERGKPFLDRGDYKMHGISVVLGLVGDVKGQVVYSMSLETALGIAGRMMGNPDLQELDEIAESAIAELGNMITGGAVCRFEKLSLNVDISPPSIVKGENVEFTRPLHPAIVIPLETDSGAMIVWLGFEES